ncbi:RNA polymerase sigma-70 factor, ECF subfamily [Sinosporangium album]|uniref:RNA polymerase sigma-70 factor, ECF subfamily n=1 Tax=Sinosporangium album TaxID=504805 RepID=A0A1G7R1A4_9ACTN|nr:sigma-70 family RNA polymerase sigma factor [Sinosporangium album]SDG04525.1 RNA polymerase sigma-70 factor, ECF subfamily [Sinosporangium album]
MGTYLGEPPPDDVVVEALRAGDETVFAQLLDLWTPGMLRLARSYLSTRDSAEEVVQDTWLAVIGNIDGFQRRSSVKTWVYRILINTAKKRQARESRTIPWSSAFNGDQPEGAATDPSRFRRGTDLRSGGWKELPALWPTPEGEALAAEARDRLATALAGLPPRQRTVITLRDVEGHTSEEVCEILEISAANQRVLLHRARASVRGVMEDYFEAASRSI